MINNLNIMLPEIFLSLSIFFILLLGVFIKKSFNLIFNLTSVIIIITIVIILNNPNNEVKIFLESFTRDSFSNYFKILILLSEIKKETGRPEGEPAPTPEQNPAGQGEQSKAVNYSLTKVTDNLTKASKLFKTVEASLRKKHKIKRLTKQQKQVAEEIACVIIANENPKDWEGKVSQYVQKPIDTNPDRIAEVREVAFEHQVDDYLASILLASKA